MSPDDICKIICEFLNKQDTRPVLFAGSGVACRVGYPTWHGWLGGLAKVCTEYDDDLSGKLITTKLEDEDYLGAATIFTTCGKIPRPERLNRMSKPFRDFPRNIELLESLVSLPFTAIITTNYEASLHHTYARVNRHSARPLELGDHTLRNGGILAEYFIARVHGRAEMPESMIVNIEDYNNLDKNEDYSDFIITLLRNRPILFIGFSFLDPAINNILTLFKNNFGPNHPNLHLAIIPEKTGSLLNKFLGDVNIRTLTYEENSNHKNLWKAIGKAANNFEKDPVKKKLPSELPKDLPQSSIHHVIAFAYARAKTPTSESQPALELVQDGVVLSLINDDKNSEVKISVAIARIRKLLRIDEINAKLLITKSIKRLSFSNDIEVSNNVIRRISKPSTELDNQLSMLSESVSDRVRVVYGINLDKRFFLSIKLIWEKIFTIRTWDLAAQYAGSVISRGINIEECVLDTVRKYIDLPEKETQSISEGILHILKYPEDRQAEALADISRAAITVQVLFSSPRQSLTSKYTLPTKLYFDTSVLLPAIAKGHPLQNGYLTAIKKLKEAAQNSGFNCKLAIGEVFANEILTHRTKALDLVQELELENPKNIELHILFYGAENTNVFVGAFSSLHSETDSKPITFSEFLSSIAPYETIEDLKFYLNKHDIVVEKWQYYDEENIKYRHIYTELKSDYYQQSLIRQNRKKDILIQHEAKQLTQLFLDATKVQRSIFVTADKRLQRIIQGNRQLEKLTGSVLSEIGFLGLVDLLVGGNPEKQIFSRLVWGEPRSDIQKQIRDYLVGLTLKRYEHAMARAMPEVMNEVFSEMKDEIDSLPEKFSNATDPNSAKSMKYFLDRLENKYFETMRAVLEDHE